MRAHHLRQEVRSLIGTDSRTIPTFTKAEIEAIAEEVGVEPEGSIPEILDDVFTHIGHTTIRRHDGNFTIDELEALREALK